MDDTWDFIQNEIRANVPSSSWVDETYSKLLDDLSFEIKAFLGASHNTSYGDAMMTMKDGELEVFKKRLFSIDEEIGQRSKGKLRVKRLDGITSLCRAHIHKMGVMEEKRLVEEFTLYIEKVRRLCLYGLCVEHDDEEIDYPSIFRVKWFDKTFHGRVWFGTNHLMFDIKQVIAKCLALNYGYKRILREIATLVNRYKNNFIRLYKTEALHFANFIIEKEYRNHNVKNYIFNSSPNEKYCVVCKGLDKTMHKVSSILVGANYPTMHPRCDCLTRPSVYIPNEMPFKEYEKLVFGNNLFT